MSDLTADLSALPVEHIDVLPASTLEALEDGHAMTEIAASCNGTCVFCACDGSCGFVGSDEG